MAEPFRSSRSDLIVSAWRRSCVPGNRQEVHPADKMHKRLPSQQARAVQLEEPVIY